MSQEKLAEEIGISKTMLSLFERGINYPMVDVWEMILDVLGGEMIIKEREGFIYEDEYE